MSVRKAKLLEIFRTQTTQVCCWMHLIIDLNLNKKQKPGINYLNCTRKILKS